MKIVPVNAMNSGCGAFGRQTKVEGRAREHEDGTSFCDGKYVLLAGPSNRGVMSLKKRSGSRVVS